MLRGWRLTEPWRVEMSKGYSEDYPTSMPPTASLRIALRYATTGFDESLEFSTLTASRKRRTMEGEEFQQTQE